MPVPKIIVDTREQAPFAFPLGHVSHEALKYGDYCLRGDRDGLVIERKSIRDLFGTMIKGAERFERELEKLSRCERPIVIVEGSVLDISLGSWQGGYGPAVLRHLLALCLKYDVWPLFTDGRKSAEEITWKLLKTRFEMKRRPGYLTRRLTAASSSSSLGSTRPTS